MQQTPYTYPTHYPLYYHPSMRYYHNQPVHWPVYNGFDHRHSPSWEDRVTLRDYGKEPYVVDINKVTKQNNTFRTAIWTGKHLQVTLMSINPGEDIGLEIHPDVDQFLRVEAGQGVVQMGPTKDNLNFKARVFDEYAIMVPAGTWHNLINTGKTPLKLYSIYAPPEHPFGTVHNMKAEAMAAEHNRY